LASRGLGYWTLLLLISRKLLPLQLELVIWEDLLLKQALLEEVVQLELVVEKNLSLEWAWLEESAALWKKPQLLAGL